ncbi:MFS transporter [Microvenator marinus]|uniref:MFS transporter n=1 Tax=Microvenator marinus TaxID=2600177 RepID=A0A5B8XQ63_9DELT|nr:MFS transporter [Microvenator marinus]QED27654.1 MFS transporter [Microvenator marinus]
MISSAERWRRFGILSALYFAQGVPFGLFSQAVPSILRQGNVSLQVIGLTSLLAAPWALKFLWSPWLDRAPFWAPGHRRRGWLIPIQSLVVLALVILAFVDPWKTPEALMAMVLVVNFLNASQDIPTDGLAVDILPAEERGRGNGIQVGGYRLGMLVGGAATLWVIDAFGWQTGLLATAFVAALCVVPIIFMKEPESLGIERKIGLGSGLGSMWKFLSNRAVLRFIGLIAAFKLGDALANGMIKPMLIDLGLSLGDIGRISGGIGFSAALAGTVAGAFLADRLTRNRALMVTAIFQAIGALIYVGVLGGEVNLTFIAIAIGVENFLGSVATVVLFACMMDWSDSDNSGMNYTVLASAVVAVQGVGSILSGFSASGLGYTMHHVVAGVIALVGGLLAAKMYRV